MRYLFYLMIVAGLAVCWFVTPIVVLAETSEDVTITATGCVLGSPDLTVYYISDCDVGLSWVKGDKAVNTMIRARYDTYPVSRNEGRLVYYGSGTECVDVVAGLGKTVTMVYYSAWSEDESGHWSVGCGRGLLEDDPHVAYNLLWTSVPIVIAAGMSMVAFVYRNPAMLITGILAGLLCWVIVQAFLSV